MITFPFPQMMGELLSKQQQGQRPRSRWDLWAATWWGDSGGREAGRGQGRAFPELMGLLLSKPGPHGEGKTAEGRWARTSGAL